MLTEIEMMKAREQFRTQKRNAERREIFFSLTFEEWLSIWLDSGHYDKRGRGASNYVMSRYSDKGNYELGNVYIQTGSDNFKEYRDINKGKPGARKGMTPWNKGIPRTDEIKKAHSERMKGRVSHTQPVMTPDGPFPSLKEAANHFNIGGLSDRLKDHPTKYYRITEQEYQTLKENI